MSDHVDLPLSMCLNLSIDNVQILLFLQGNLVDTKVLKKTQLIRGKVQIHYEE